MLERGSACGNGGKKRKAKKCVKSVEWRAPLLIVFCNLRAVSIDTECRVKTAKKGAPNGHFGRRKGQDSRAGLYYQRSDAVWSFPSQNAKLLLNKHPIPF